MPLISPAPLGSSTWLLRLRSFATIGQLITIILARFVTPTTLPILPLFLMVLLTATTNFVYGWWLVRIKKNEVTASPLKSPYGKPAVERENDCIGTPLRVAFGLMALDLVTLTVMLYLSGGADNPFCFFYFVNLAVGGVMLHRGAAWALTVLAVAGYATLLWQSMPVLGLSVQPIDGAVWRWNTLSMRNVASLIAFVTCGSVITYFVTRTARTLRDREEDLLRSQSERADAIRLEGLTTLAAGAAHELATPLSAIDVACRELSRHLEAVDKPSSIDDDLRLIDGQLQICRQVLTRMRSAAGDAVADQWNRTTLGELIDTVLEGIRDPHRVEILEPDTPWVPDLSHHSLPSQADDHDGTGGVDDDTPPWELQPMWLPQEAVAQAIRNLIHNALDASSDADSTVTVQAQRLGNEMAIYVIDRGHGMSEDVLGRAGEPFFTTKEPGRGIGLGLFLTRNVITRLGGRLSFDSNPGSGTRATVILPLP
ncbi:sensor histidine kinase [Neorhodopirellula pilleata]|uniref:histidine kinase n=1 Tax=Neorhodopirellula pilleata TaxID=2714738 RepID=A0A5C6AT08_9BACT|nr:ATP-binding protein [Neorhodopirellula pilleata]TWU03135.1 Sensor histidine kinase RegB [Neorhodopirellula pilleata]